MEEAAMDDLRLPTPPPVVHAPTYRLPPPDARLHIATVEYPGPVNSLDNALNSLGGLANVARSFVSYAPSPQTGEEEPPAAANAVRHPLELDLDPKNRFAHPVAAHIAKTSNVVCRVVKRRRKNPLRDENGQVREEGIYEIQPVAVENRLARFRAMADYQYAPKRHDGQDPTLDLADAIINMNVAGIRKFAMPPPNEDFPESAFLPPPAFSRHTVPQIFDMHPAQGTVRVTTDAGVTRLVNARRYKVRSVQSILFVQPTVPTGPEKVLLDELGKEELSPIEQRVKDLLEERPCWTRTALLNQLTAEEVKALNANKSCWSMVSYTFADGPFRDLAIRFGYDPRDHPEARFYQHVSLRNLANVRHRAQPGMRSQAQAGAASSRRGDKAQATSNHSHEFDGEHVYGKIGNYQLCDISDPLIKSLIDAPEGVLPACSSDPHEGWYAYDYFEQIRQVLRRKWQALLNGLQVEDEDFEELLGWELSRESRAGRAKKSRMGTTAAAAAGAASGGGAGAGGKGRGGARGRSGSASSSQSAASSTGRRGRADSPSDSSRSAGSRSEQSGSDGDGDDDGEGLDWDESAGLDARAAAAGRGDESNTAVGTMAESSPAARGVGTSSGSRGGRRSSTAAATAAGGTPGPSGTGPRRPRPSLAPWEKPKRKRAQAKQPETEAELFARINRAARRSQLATAPSSSSPAPKQQQQRRSGRQRRIDPETGEDIEEDSTSEDDDDDDD